MTVYCFEQLTSTEILYSLNPPPPPGRVAYFLLPYPKQCQSQVRLSSLRAHISARCCGCLKERASLSACLVSAEEVTGAAVCMRPHDTPPPKTHAVLFCGAHAHRQTLCSTWQTHTQGLASHHRLHVVSPQPLACFLALRTALWMHCHMRTHSSVWSLRSSLIFGSLCWLVVSNEMCMSVNEFSLVLENCGTRRLPQIRISRSLS